MIVRCGRCRSQFDVPGAGRHICPACGTPNDVREEPMVAPRPAPDPGPPSPRVTCASCGFSFIIGAVTVAPCPNCTDPVTVSETESEDV